MPSEVESTVNSEMDERENILPQETKPNSTFTLHQVRLLILKKGLYPLIKLLKVAVRGLEDKVITQFSCGHQHTIALDKEGIVYVWGYNGYCRLGLGNQQDVLIPKTVPQVLCLLDSSS